MAYVFSKRSKTNLQGVHPDLVWICARALRLSKYDFTVTEGLRTYERQVKLKAEGKSKTLNSKHLKQADGWGHAFDAAVWVNGEIKWEAKHYEQFAEACKQAARELGVAIQCGYDWKGHWDPYHVQLDTMDGEIHSKADKVASLEVASTAL